MIPKTFIKFAVSGDAPSSSDEAALSILQEFAFKQQSLGVPQEIEFGFVTGEHVFDTQFTYSKNGYGPALLFALRIDTHKVPSDIKQAYKRQHEQAVAAGKENSLGFLSKQEKREAAEMTARQLQEDMASGKYRKSKMVPILWDLKNKDMYFGATSNEACEKLHKIMRDSFNVDLDQLTAGAVARTLMQSQRDFEDIRPLAFTAPPAGAIEDHDNTIGGQDVSIPIVPWATISIDVKDFLGNEFLLWLWWISEAFEGEVDFVFPGHATREKISILFDKTLHMDCAWGVTGKQTLTGDGPTRLREAGEALLTGKWPRKAGLIFADTVSGEQWEMIFSADLFIFGGLKLPPTDEAQCPREVIEQKITSLIRISQIMHGVYVAFLRERFVASKTLKITISNWIKEHGRKAS